MEVRCSSPLVIKGKHYGEKCNKYLGTFQLLFGFLYCKSCGKKNYYQVITEKGLSELRRS